MNGTLWTIGAMPQKDLTSDGTSSFAMGRKKYSETYGSEIVKEKKYIGGNQDASSVVERRKKNEIGVGTKNAGGVAMSFTTVRDVNVENNALRRVRAGGSYVRKTTKSGNVDVRKYIF